MEPDIQGSAVEGHTQMILVDSRVGSAELLVPIRRLGIPVEKAQLSYGDACFEGHGPKGLITVGVERKTIPDMLHCIDDARYTAHQLPGMAKMYDKSILALEGEWMMGTKPFYEGILMTRKEGQYYPLTYRSRRVMYSKLYRYLLSIALSGVIITYSRDQGHTAANICENYHYFQKKWENHTSLLEIQKLALPEMRGETTLVRRWASQLSGVGVKHSMQAEHIFKRAIDLARSDETEWLQIPGLGVATAQNIIKEIWK